MTQFVDSKKWQHIAQEVLQLARKEGATSAEMSASVTDGFAVQVRLGEVETVEYQRDKSVDISVYMGQQRGSSSTSDVSSAALYAAVKAACDIARVTASDPCHGLADPKLLQTHFPDLDLYYPWALDVNQGIEIAKQCEQAALSFDKRITNSEGASLSTYQSFYLYANSENFLGHHMTTRHSLSCSLIAEKNQQKQRNYDYSNARDANDLWPAKRVGESAAERTVRRIDSQRLTTRRAPIIFSADIARTLLKHFINAIDGYALYNNASFLLGHLDKKIFPDFVTISENPYLKKGWGSTAFDGDGVATSERDFIEHGILKSYVLDTYAARKLNMQTTGNAGGVHNLFITPNAGDLNDMLKKMDTGLLVTELMGQGVNRITGDYSRGASGFWVEKGEIQYPVHEITIAGNLRDMFLHMIAVGNDIDYRGNVCSGSILIEQMMIAGD